MSLIQPRTPAGTVELLPREQVIFQHMMDVIRRGYESFGFVPVETPVFEVKDVLLTKSGGETEKQVYFVQSTGALKQGRDPDLALRFDLTVPLARYVAQHERNLAFPFRRYQMQRVYRGERAQRGRSREFYQCDLDVIGKDKLDTAYDAEIPAIIVEIFTELGIKGFTIHFSNRKILLGLLSAWDMEDSEKQKLILREIDKLDKIGPAKVREALIALGLDAEKVDSLLALVALKGSKDDILAALNARDETHPIFLEGRNELTKMVASLRALGVDEARTCINLAIARGLDYYTGTVYETLIDDHHAFGSVCSGGRYENLAGYYTKSKLPGVGMSIGLTRLYEQLAAVDLLPPAPHKIHILITQMDASLAPDYLELAATLRKEGFSVENYLEQSKLDKQLKYADKKNIPLALLIGSRESEAGVVQVKDLVHHAQFEVERGDLVARLYELLKI
ncbi:MAG TPA: histidine--tRNA ligase [Rhodospirillaceae bacterium]|nr:histidine--tRNA ligase [Rhodospirillaceae bacterium]